MRVVDSRCTWNVFFIRADLTSICFWCLYSFVRWYSISFVCVGCPPSLTVIKVYYPVRLLCINVNYINFCLILVFVSFTVIFLLKFLCVLKTFNFSSLLYPILYLTFLLFYVYLQRLFYKLRRYQLSKCLNHCLYWIISPMCYSGSIIFKCESV